VNREINDLENKRYKIKELLKRNTSSDSCESPPESVGRHSTVAGWGGVVAAMF
jgi:hypothetical protein